jgi:hypothetical protein
MARKRGGLAGLYDRNKGVFQTAAPILAGAIGGPMAGAAVGAAMRGFDRPGKSGVGFDVGQGIQGGLSGYGAGALGQSARGALQGRLAGMFTGGASNPLQSAQSMIDSANQQIIPQLSSAGAAAPSAAAPAAGFNAQQYLSDAASRGASKPMQLGRGVSTNTPEVLPPKPRPSGLGRIAAFAEKNPNLTGQAIQGLMSGGQTLEEREYEDAQELARTRASLVAQMLTGGTGAFGFPGESTRGYGSLNTAMYNMAPETYAPNYARDAAATNLSNTMADDMEQPFGMRRAAPLPQRGRSAGMFGPGMR